MAQTALKLFHKATKSHARIRLALVGPSGSGKTYTALRIAEEMVPKGSIAVIDSQRGQASKYADVFTFDVAELASHSAESYMKAIAAAEAEGYQLCIIDTLSHEWVGRDGALEQVDRITARSRSGSTFPAWRQVTPPHNALIDAIVSSKMHIIATMRAKTDWVLEPNDKGKMVPRRVGTAPIQREGIDFEFDVVGDMTADNQMIISKTHCSTLNGGIFTKPGPEVAEILLAWLGRSKVDDPVGPTPLMDDPEIKALFDQLGALEAKRRAACSKYSDRDTLIAALEARVKDAESAKAKATPKAKGASSTTNGTQPPAT